jgi:hypothetical protein
MPYPNPVCSAFATNVSIHCKFIQLDRFDFRQLPAGAAGWIAPTPASDRNGISRLKHPITVLRLGIICLSENAEDGKMLSTARSGPNCPRRYPGLIRINAPIRARH